MLTDPNGTIAPNAESRLTQQVGRQYLFLFLLIPVLGYFAPFVMDGLRVTPNFLQSEWSRILDTSYRTRGVDADVVVFGDSSALYDIDILRLSSELHLKVINLPSTLGTLPVMKDEPLREYLKANRPPRLIVYYFAPWGLDAANHPNQFMFDGEELMLRNEGFKRLISFGVKNPAELGLYPFRFYASRSDVVDNLLGIGEQKPKPVMGHVDFAGKKFLTADCAMPDKLLRERDFAFTRDLVEKTPTGSGEMVFLAPVPQCSRAAELASLEYPALGAEPPALLNPTGFADDQLYVHAAPIMTALCTDRLAEAIRRKLVTLR
jgi:hypothetical protein